MLKKVYPILPWVQVRTTAVKEDSSFEVSMFRKPPTRRLIDLILLFMPSATALVLHSVGNLIRCAEAAIDQSANVANVANPIKHLDELYRKPKTGSDPMALELATIKDILVNESTAHSLLCYVACIFRSQMERLTLVSKFTSVTIAMLRIPKRLRGMESTHCLLLMQGGGHLLAQPNQITSPDRELFTIRRELRLFTEEFKRSRRSIDSKAEVEAEAAKLAARETDFRQKRLNLAERNPGKSKGPSIYA